MVNNHFLAGLDRVGLSCFVILIFFFPIIAHTVCGCGPRKTCKPPGEAHPEQEVFLVKESVSLVCGRNPNDNMQTQHVVEGLLGLFESRVYLSSHLRKILPTLRVPDGMRSGMLFLLQLLSESAFSLLHSCFLCWRYGNSGVSVQLVFGHFGEVGMSGFNYWKFGLGFGSRIVPMAGPLW